MLTYRQFQDYQPISITGAIRHVGLWLTSSATDQVHILNEQPTSDNPITIYCIPGTADRVSSFSLLIERLKINKQLPDSIHKIVVVAFANRAEGKSIEFFSEQLRDNIKARKDSHVIVMGHSRGGIIGAHFAENLAEEAGIKVYGVIPICSPFWGSSLAYNPISILSTSIQQMQVGSEFLKILREKIAHTKIEYLCFAAEKDLLVTMESANIVDIIRSEKSKYYLLTRHGHLSVMSSHRLVKFIEEFVSAFALSAKAESASSRQVTPVANPSLSNSR